MLKEETGALRAAEIINRLSKNEIILSFISELQKELSTSAEQFVWKTLDEFLSDDELHAEFKSSWMFVLRKNTPSQAHYHPNSTQYTAMIEGSCEFELDGARSSLKKFNPADPDSLYVIPPGVPHEFFPGEKDMVVISLHTAKADELIEIHCGQNKERTYK